MRRNPRSARPAGFAAGAAFGFLLFLALGAVSYDSLPKGETAAEAPPADILLLAVGDMAFSRRVAERLPAEGWNGLFDGVRGLLAGSDLAFGNLETSVSLRGSPHPDKADDLSFRAPPGILFGLKRAGFSVLSLANNHIGDYGPLALSDTLEALETIGIGSCGAGRNGEEAHRPYVAVAGGKRFAFLAYVERWWNVVEAGPAEPGVAVLELGRMAADVRAARENADFVIVSLHWGEEHQGVPREADRETARGLVDAGADAVLGHHPHVLQGAEFYRGKPILYSLGNFVFDMQSPSTYESAAAILRFGPEGPREVRFVPLRIDRNAFAPAPAAGEDARSIGGLLADRSAALGGKPEALEDGSYRMTASRAASPSVE